VARRLKRESERDCEEREEETDDAQGWATASAPPLSLKSLCGGGVPSSHPSLGLSVFFLSFFYAGTTRARTPLARTGTHTSSREKNWPAQAFPANKKENRQRVPSTLRFRKFPGKTEGVWCSILETREFP